VFADTTHGQGEFQRLARGSRNLLPVVDWDRVGVASSPETTEGRYPGGTGTDRDRSFRVRIICSGQNPEPAHGTEVQFGLEV